MALFCEYCGSPLNDDARFCTNCGHTVGQANQPSPPQQPSPNPQPSFRPSPQATQPRQPKKKGGCLKALLILAVVVVVIVGAVKYYEYRRDKRIYKENTTYKPPMIPKQPQQSQDMEEPADVVENGDDDWFNSLALTEEDLEYLKENPIVVTPENSPGNPAFIEVTYTEEEYTNAPTVAALVTRESPEVDLPELGIHVNMQSWNLNYEQDSLIVKRLPDKVDEATGMILHSCDYSLVSKQHTFLTGVEITAPVQGDPDAFAGFVSYNEATGRWEEVYYELSEDGLTYTAYPTSFSKKASLERIKTEGMDAIEKYKIDGKSIFVQLKNEMKPKYIENSHYLYPVTVARTADLEKFITSADKTELDMINKMVVESGKMPSQSSFTKGLQVVGFLNDGVANTKAAVDFFKNTANKAPGQMSAFAPAVALVGSMCYALNVADQTMRDVDKGTITEENESNFYGALVGCGGAVSEYAEAAGLAMAEKGGAMGAKIAGVAGVASTLATVVGAIMFANSIKTMIVDYETSETFPLGEYAPISIADAACHCYMRDNAFSDNGYAKKPVTGLASWFTTSEAPIKKLDSAMVYRHHPEKLLDCHPANWLLAYECLLKQHPNDIKALTEAYDQLYYKFADAFWNEPPEIQKKYFRQACRDYIKILKFTDSGALVMETTLERATSFREAPIGNSLDLEAKNEWIALQGALLTKTRQVRQELRFATIDYVWNEIFKAWDQDPEFEMRYIKRIKNNPILLEKHRNRDIQLLMHNTSSVIRDFYKTKHQKAIMEVENKLHCLILPLLNTRLTFYANNLDDPNGIHKPTNYGGSALPTFAFKCDKKAKFRPGNAYEVKPCFPLELRPNWNNPVLLETTVYHYLMFGCPVEVETNIMVDDKPVMAKANWDKVELVTDEKLKDVVNEMAIIEEESEKYNTAAGVYQPESQGASLGLYFMNQKGYSDTQIPVEFRIKREIIEEYTCTSYLSIADSQRKREYEHCFLGCSSNSEFKSHVQIMKNGEFYIVSSGECENSLLEETTNVVTTGHIDKKTGTGSFTMKGSKQAVAKDDGMTWTVSIEGVGEIKGATIREVGIGDGWFSVEMNDTKKDLGKFVIKDCTIKESSHKGDNKFKSVEYQDKVYLELKELIP